MKLYSTIENDKHKSCGVGSDESITMNVNKGNRRMCEFYITIEMINNKEFMAIDMLNLSDGSTTRVYEYEWSLKGVKQKGEKCEVCGEPLLDNHSISGNRHSACI